MPTGEGRSPRRATARGGDLRVLGVRHHGPGSARAVVRALVAHDPDVVLIEGPPEADALVVMKTGRNLPRVRRALERTGWRE